MDISVIIVTYQTADLIIPCLESVFGNRGCDFEVHIVDNASTDQTLDFIRQGFPDVHLIANTSNRGFSAANNQALRNCRGEFILFLNPDTQVKPDTFTRSLAYMRKVPHVGLGGPKILNPDGSLQESISYRYPGEKYGKKNLPPMKGTIACVLGAAMVARREAIDGIGGFDEDFFLYGEDEDLCLRIRKTGWEIGFIEEAVVVHLGGYSERTTVSAEKWRKKVRAEYLFYTKHYRPETIARIRRMERMKARWRLLSLAFTLPFANNKDRIQEKMSRYGVILEETRRVSSADRR